MANFTPEQQQFLEQFRRTAFEAENAQCMDLILNCHNKFQFAKTYRVYRRDLARANEQIRDRVSRGDLGPGVTPEVAEEMIRIGTQAVEEKMKRCADHFLHTWGEPITNYAGAGTGCAGVILAIVAIAAIVVVVLLWLVG